MNSPTLNADLLHKAPGQFAELFSRPRSSFYAPALIFGLIIHVVGCKKSNQAPAVLPPITAEGKNTFGCKINGRVWVPYEPCRTIGRSIPELEYYTFPVDSSRALPIFFHLSAFNESDDFAYFNFEFDGYHSFGLSQTGNIIDSLYIAYGVYQCYFLTGSPHYFNITKLDTINKVVDGEFAFVMYARLNGSNQMDSILVTDGRFDIQMNGFSSCSRQ